MSLYHLKLPWSHLLFFPVNFVWKDHLYTVCSVVRQQITVFDEQWEYLINQCGSF